MRVLVDGQPHGLLLSAPPNVASVIAEIDESLELNGRAIQRVIVDGESWPLEELAETLARLSVDGVDLLEIESEDLRVLVERSLTEIETVIDELPGACHTLATLLNGPDREEALESYQELRNVWLELIERHRQVFAALKRAPDEVNVAGMPLPHWQSNVRALVNRGAALADNGDAPALADLLSYEIVQFAEQEAEVIAALRNVVKGAASQ